ncbi:MAG: hypothetical protein EKK57_00360 [Proteobacteria bacterium]|nr:MAG: hypothetical protein EKK57_00360 [Pseudomonadota bacterium]
MMSKKNKKSNSKDLNIKKIIANPYTIPPNLLNLLKEHSLGYILFTVDFNGNVAFNIHADNEILADGLKDKLATMLVSDREAREAVMSELMAQNLMNQIREQQGFDDDNDDGDSENGDEPGC